MNVAYYVLAFDLVTDTVYETWGLGLDYPEREKHSTANPCLSPHNF
jgi:hypothetical protein